eukprot:gene8972-1306_t
MSIHLCVTSEQNICTRVSGKALSNSKVDSVDGTVDEGVPHICLAHNTQDFFPGLLRTLNGVLVALMRPTSAIITKRHGQRRLNPT